MDKEPIEPKEESKEIVPETIETMEQLQKKFETHIELPMDCTFGSTRKYAGDRQKEIIEKEGGYEKLTPERQREIANQTWAEVWKICSLRAKLSKTTKKETQAEDKTDTKDYDMRD